MKYWNIWLKIWLFFGNIWEQWSIVDTLYTGNLAFFCGQHGIRHKVTKVVLTKPTENQSTQQPDVPWGLVDTATAFNNTETNTITISIWSFLTLLSLLSRRTSRGTLYDYHLFLGLDGHTGKVIKWLSSWDNQKERDFGWTVVVLVKLTRDGLEDISFFPPFVTLDTYHLAIDLPNPTNSSSYPSLSHHLICPGHHTLSVSGVHLTTRPDKKFNPSSVHLIFHHDPNPNSECFYQKKDS